MLSIINQYQRLFFLALILLGNVSFKAHCATEKDFQTWLNLTVIGSFDNKKEWLKRLQYWLEGQERVGNDSTHITQTLLRPGLGYAFNDSTSLWLGYAFIRTGAPLTTSPFKEDRIWQQLLWIKKFEPIIIISRTRTEQRFLENNHKTAYRVRQLFKLTYPLKINSKLSIISSDEVFFHKNNFIGRNSKGFDQNRFFIGLGYEVNSALVTEIGYMSQYIRRVGVPNFAANILAINFFLSL